MKKSNLVVGLILVILLSGCAETNPAPTLIEATKTSTVSVEPTDTFTPTASPTSTPTVTPTENPYASIDIGLYGYPVLYGMEDLNQDGANFFLHTYDVLNPLFQFDKSILDPVFIDFEAAIQVPFSAGQLTGPINYIFEKVFYESFAADCDPQETCIFESPTNLPVEFFDCAEEWPSRYSVSAVCTFWARGVFPDMHTGKYFLINITDQEFCQVLEDSAHRKYGIAHALGTVAALREYTFKFGDPAFKEQERQLYCSNFDPESEDFLLFTRYLGNPQIAEEVLRAVTTNTPTPTATLTLTPTPTPTQNTSGGIGLLPSGYPVLHGMSELNKDSEKYVWHAAEVLELLFFDFNTSVAIAFSEGRLSGPLAYILDKAFHEPYNPEVVKFYDAAEVWPSQYNESTVAILPPESFPFRDAREEYIYNISDQEFCNGLEDSALQGFGIAHTIGTAAAIKEYIKFIGEPTYKLIDSKLYCSNLNPWSEDFLMYTRYIGNSQIVDEVLVALSHTD